MCLRRRGLAGRDDGFPITHATSENDVLMLGRVDPVAFSIVSRSPPPLSSRPLRSAAYNRKSRLLRQHYDALGAHADLSITLGELAY